MNVNNSDTTDNTEIFSNKSDDRNSSSEKPRGDVDMNVRMKQLHQIYQKLVIFQVIAAQSRVLNVIWKNTFL